MRKPNARLAAELEEKLKLGILSEARRLGSAGGDPPADSAGSRVGVRQRRYHLKERCRWYSPVLSQQEIGPSSVWHRDLDCRSISWIAHVVGLERSKSSARHGEFRAEKRPSVLPIEVLQPKFYRTRLQVLQHMHEMHVHEYGHFRSF